MDGSAPTHHAHTCRPLGRIITTARFVGKDPASLEAFWSKVAQGLPILVGNADERCVELVRTTKNQTAGDEQHEALFLEEPERRFMTELQHAVRFTKCLAEQLQAVPVDDLKMIDLDRTYAEYCEAVGVPVTSERRGLLDDIQEVYAEQVGHDHEVPTWRSLVVGLEMRGWRRDWLYRPL